MHERKERQKAACAEEDLAHPAEDPADVVAIRGSTLRVLYRFAVALNASESLVEIAALTARATHDALQGHSVHVQLWDDDAGTGTIEADDGAEMSSEMHREALATHQGQVGEIVVDAHGPRGRRLSGSDREVLTMIAVPTAVAVNNHFRRRERDRAQHATILALARLSEQRDNETGRHIERVSLFCELVATGLCDARHYTDEITGGFIEDLVRSAPLHDIGKVGIPDSILLKPGKLTPSEWEIMKTHTTLGAQTLDEVIRETRDPGFLAMGRDIAWCHHEKWDGSGYPRGLAGLEIPLCARILAVADIYDALTTQRPYKKAWAHEEAVRWIRGLRGNHLDPRVVDVFLARAESADGIRARLADTADDVRRLEEFALASL